MASLVRILLPFILTAPIEIMSSFLDLSPVVSQSYTTYSSSVVHQTRKAKRSSVKFLRFRFCFNLSNILTYHMKDENDILILFLN